MVIESIIGVIASAFTIASTLGWVLDKNGRRIEGRFNSIEKKFDTVIEIVTEMRATMPLQYTLKEDHLRLADRVDEIRTDVVLWKHKETRP